MKHPLKYEESAHLPFAESDVLHVDHVPLSSDADNALERRADGLYVEDCCNTARGASMCMVGWEMDDAGFPVLTDAPVIVGVNYKTMTIRLAYKITPGTTGPWTLQHIEPGLPTLTGSGRVVIENVEDDEWEVLAETGFSYGYISANGQVAHQGMLSPLVSEEEGKPLCVIVDEITIHDVESPIARIVYVNNDTISDKDHHNRFRINVLEHTDNGSFLNYPLYWPTESLCSKGSDAIPPVDYPGIPMTLPPAFMHLAGIYQDQDSTLIGGQTLELRCWITTAPYADPVLIQFNLSGNEQDAANYSLSVEVPVGQSQAVARLQTQVNGPAIGHLRIEMATTSVVMPAMGASGTSYFDVVVTR